MALDTPEPQADRLVVVVGQVFVFQTPSLADGFYVIRKDEELVNGWEEVGGPYHTRSAARRDAADRRLRGRWLIGECTRGVLTVARPDMDVLDSEAAR